MSLRLFVEELRSRGLVESITRVLGRDLEPTRYMLDADKRGATLLFRVEGWSSEIVSGVVNTREKLYRALHARGDEEAYMKLLNALEKPSKPSYTGFPEYLKRVEDDVTRLPFIKFYRGDGGRYLTSSIYIACIEGVCNASIHRTMLVGRRELVARIVPRHLYYIHRRYAERGLETPVAIVVGVHPAVMLAAASSPPFGVFEIEVAASMLPDLKVALTPRYGIPVPIPAAVIIEGRITRQRVREGPFTDLTNTYDRVREEPLIKVDAVYVSDELFHVVLPGGNEHMYLQGFPREALIWRAVRSVVPRVHKVRLTRGGGRWLHAVVSIDKLSDGDPKVVGMAAFAAHPSLKAVVVVDSDVDPDDPVDVEWAIATRFQASRDLVVIARARCSSLDPSSEDGICDKVLIDATAPLKDRDRFRKVIEGF